jgi:hypothetical protein
MPQIGQLPGPTWLGGELGEAARAAEVISVAIVVGLVRRVRGLDRHAADRIGRGRFYGGSVGGVVVLAA